MGESESKIAKDESETEKRDNGAKNECENVEISNKDRKTSSENKSSDKLLEDIKLEEENKEGKEEHKEGSEIAEKLLSPDKPILSNVELPEPAEAVRDNEDILVN